ncbi:hypothetical protein [Actibacterium mucosum]|nr:hypothetical protein [Actibacterium mucosum]
MTTLTHGYRSLSLLWKLNWDRVLCTGVLFGALIAGSYLASNI